MRLWRALLVLLLGPLLADGYQRLWSRPKHPASAPVSELLGEAENSGGFSYPKPGRPFRFPDDHGPHRDFRSEWWYFTGNLDSPEGPFGYELTFFRQALLGPLQRVESRTSAWANPENWMVHFAVTDIVRKRHQPFQRLSRSALQLAGASRDRVWLEDWVAQRTGQNDFHLKADRDGWSLDLTLQALKYPVLQGENGYSQKGDRPEQSSHYYSLTRLQTRGEIQTPAGHYKVTGQSWMDREWSTQALDASLAGWDWFALQLDSGQDVMYYQLRKKSGQASDWSRGCVVDQDGRVQRFSKLPMDVGKYWASPLDGSRYPAQWTLTVPGVGRLTVVPRLENQEVLGVARYWEGAVVVSGQGLKGQGYVELVGYDSVEKK